MARERRFGALHAASAQSVRQRRCMSTPFHGGSTGHPSFAQGRNGEYQGAATSMYNNVVGLEKRRASAERGRKSCLTIVAREEVGLQLLKIPAESAYVNQRHARAREDLSSPFQSRGSSSPGTRKIFAVPLQDHELLAPGEKTVPLINQPRNQIGLCAKSGDAFTLR